MTNSGPVPSAKELPKFSGIPPIRKLGARWLSANSHANREDVVVLPCVPAITRRSLPARNSSNTTRAIDSNGTRWSSMYSSSTLPREIAFPTITRSGLGSRFFSLNGCATGMLSDARKSDIGG